jgi:V8-like Glu-specific endopeptidase
LDTHKHNRPLTWQQIKSLPPVKATAERPADFPSRNFLSFYVQSPRGNEVAPSVEVEYLSPGEYGVGICRVRIELPNTVVAHLPGRRTHHLDLPSPASGMGEHRVAGLDSFRPPWIDATFIPATAPRPKLPRIFAKDRKVRPLYVGPDDRRQILTDTSYPWLLTGKIFTSDGTSGSGVLVGDRVVLTARHVVPWTSIAAGNWWMKFVPAYFDGREPFGSSYVSDVTNYGTDDSEYNLSHDYAVLRLFDPLGAWLGYLGSTEFDDGWRNNDNFINIGYMSDIAGSQEPVWQRYWIEDDYEDDDGQTLETEASLNYGASGGPFFGWFDNGSQIRVIGAVTGETGFGDDVDNSLAGGPNMVNLIDWGRANWPK